MIMHPGQKITTLARVWDWSTHRKNEPSCGWDGESIKDESQNVDFGLILGVEFPFLEDISIDVRYKLGLSTIDDSGSRRRRDIKNRMFSVTMHFDFEK